MEFQIEDFLEEYPTPYREDIQSEIARYYEMQEVITTKKDRKLEGSPFFTQQDLYQRTAYFSKKNLYVAEAGVGKTCSEIALREFLKNNDPWTTKAYFVTGNAQIEDFKKQVVYGCTAHLYETSKLHEHQTTESASKGLAKAINSIVEKNFKVITHTNFYKEVYELVGNLDAKEGNRLIQEYYSSIYFFFDEIHFLKITDSTVLKQRERFDHYWMLWRVCHLVNGSRITLSSATPHSNDIREFGHIVNIILPLDNQMKVDDNFYTRHKSIHELNIKYGPSVNWDIIEVRGRNDDLEEAAQYYTDIFKKYLSGMLIYISAADTGVEMSYIPVEEPNAKGVMKRIIDNYRRIGLVEDNEYKRLRVLTFVDGGIQMKAYDKYKNKRNGGRTSVAQNVELQILTAVVPESPGLEENWGKKAFNHWFEQDKKKLSWYTIREDVTDFNGVGLKEYYSNNLLTLSPKYYYAMIGMTQGIGKCYAFFPGVEQVGGVYDFGLALENGLTVTLLEPTEDKFTRFDYLQRQGRREIKNWTSVPSGQLAKHIDKAPRYAIISGKQTSKEFSNILDLYNHPDNMYGEYLKVLLVSKRGQTGVNFSSVRRVYSFYITHNPVDEYQAIMRARRATSHTKIIKDWKERFGYDFEVEVNLMIVIYPEGHPGGRDTEDNMIYNRTRSLDENRLIINRAIKKISITGLLTRDRNIGDNEYDQECDYMRCDFEFVTDEERSTLYHNFITLYSERLVKLEKKSLIRELQKKSYLSIPNYISSKGGDYISTIVCHLAIAELCENKDEIYDKFGYLATVSENNGILYFNRGNVSKNGFMIEYYNVNLIGIQRRTLRSLNRLRDYKTTGEFFNKLAMMNTEEEMSELISNTKVGELAIAYEKFIKDYYIGNNPILSRQQIDMFYSIIELDEGPGNVIRVPQPLNALNKVSSDPKNELPHNFEILSSLDKDNNIVFAHSVYTTEEKRTKSSQAQKSRMVEGTIRIFVVSEGEWRDANVYEAIVYRRIFQERISTHEMNVSAKFPIYGIISRNTVKGKSYPVLMIKDNEKETSREAPGSACNLTQRKVDIFRVMISIGMHEEYQYNSNEFQLMSYRHSIASYKRENEELFLQKYFTSKGKDWYFSLDQFILVSRKFYDVDIDEKELIRISVGKIDKRLKLLKEYNRDAVRELYREYKRIATGFERRSVEDFINTDKKPKTLPFVQNRISELDKISNSSKAYLNGTGKYDNYVRVALKMEVIDMFDGNKMLATDDMTAYGYYILMTNQTEMNKAKICNMMAKYMHKKGMLMYKDITKDEAERLYNY